RVLVSLWSSFFLVFYAPAPPEIYTLSLHDALPILSVRFTHILRSQYFRCCAAIHNVKPQPVQFERRARPGIGSPENSVSGPLMRSEEHTSELQSRENLVCRLLLEKKKLKRKVALEI